MTTLAGSTPGDIDAIGAAAKFHFPSGLAIDPFNDIYVADRLNHKIRKVTSSRVVTSFAGTGNPGYVDGDVGSSQFKFPGGVTLDGDFNIYVADVSNHKIRLITQKNELQGSAIGQAGDHNVTLKC